MSIRAVEQVSSSMPTIEGAGVKLRRAFGFGDPETFDPFLLLDDFRNERPEDYLAGFPWHPHRGIETITYVLAGTVEHGDSLGNRGSLGAGDVQWMTAGRGIIHQEMPQGDPDGRMHGFQLWANLPSSLKMTAPRYQDVGLGRHPDRHRRRRHRRARRVRLVLGADRAGRRHRRRADLPRRLGAARAHQATARGDHPARVRLHVRRVRPLRRRLGAPAGPHRPRRIRPGGAGGRRARWAIARWWCSAAATRWSCAQATHGMRFLLVSGKPIQEPVAWAGPIVMNTREELEDAFSQLKDGTFLGG